jgi:hypothetical protein
VLLLVLALLAPATAAIASPPTHPGPRSGAGDRAVVMLEPGTHAPTAARGLVAHARRLGAEGAELYAVGEALGVVVLDDVPPGIERALQDRDGVSSITREAWLEPMLAVSTTTVGAARVAADGLDGRGHAVAVIDTGIDTSHPALREAVVAEACFSRGNSGPGCPNGGSQQLGRGAGVPCAQDASNCRHGTHVAGIVGARPVGAEAAGVAPGADLVAVQVFDPSGSWASTADVVLALDWVLSVAADHRIAAVNLSLGIGSYGGACDADWKEMSTAVKRLTQAGITTVAATGNGGLDGAISAPACLADVIAVGATTSTDRLASFSNISTTTDLLAPGEAVRAPVTGGGYAKLSGTSMAAPHVAGAVAILRQLAPEATPAQLGRALRQTGTQVTTPVGNRPRLDIDRARRAPGRPGSVAATHGDRRATITWQTASQNGGSNVTGYRVTASPGGRSVQVAATARSATLTGLDNGVRHTFDVRAINEVRAGSAGTSNLVIPKPAPGPHGFPDVPKGVYYDLPVRWLKAEGITDGYGTTGTYAPDRTVTRAQMAAFLWRTADQPTGAPAHGFPDVPRGSYYEDAVRWLKAHGITDGYGNTGTYAPDRAVTRAQMAAFLHRLASSPAAWGSAPSIPSTIVF